MGKCCIRQLHPWRFILKLPPKLGSFWTSCPPAVPPAPDRHPARREWGQDGVPRPSVCSSFHRPAREKQPQADGGQTAAPFWPPSLLPSSVPGQIHDPLPQNLLQRRARDQLAQQILPEHLEFVLVFPPDDGLPGKEAMLEGVLGDLGLPRGRTGSGGLLGVGTIGFDLRDSSHELPSESDLVNRPPHPGRQVCILYHITTPISRRGWTFAKWTLGLL